ncbi:MAG: pilus assembly protein CpaE, partial [Planctomycetales bacterium]|nr:pilus assembly protein CpaE [Planctomycetales bacterium]
MANVLRLAIVDPDDGNRDDLKTLLLGIDSVWLEAECSRYDFFPSIVEQSSPDVGVIAIDSDPDKAMSLIEQLSSSGSCQIAVVSASNDGSLILRAMRAGAKEFLTLPIQTDEFLKALDRLNSSDGGGESRGRSCKCIAIAGASGGVGSTSMAVNLGCALAANEANNVVLIDLDISLGDADVFLDTIPDYALADVSQNVSRMDFSLLKKSLTKHSSGLYLLPRPVQLQDSN